MRPVICDSCGKSFNGAYSILIEVKQSFADDYDAYDTCYEYCESCGEKLVDDLKKNKDAVYKRLLKL